LISDGGFVTAEYSVAITTDARYMAAGNDRNSHLHVLDVANKQLLWQYNTGNIQGVAVSADGQYILAGATNTVYLFDVSGNLLWTQEIAGIRAVGLSADASLIVVATASGHVVGFDVLTNLENRMVLDRKTLRLPALAFDGDGSDLQLTLTGGGPGQWIHVQAGRHQSHMVPAGLFHNRLGTDPWTIGIDITSTDLGWIEYVDVASTHSFEFGTVVTESDLDRLLFRLGAGYVESANAGTMPVMPTCAWKLYEYQWNENQRSWNTITVEELGERSSEKRTIILTHGWGGTFAPSNYDQSAWIHEFVGGREWPQDIQILALDWYGDGCESCSVNRTTNDRRLWRARRSARNGIHIGKTVGTELAKAGIQPSNLYLIGYSNGTGLMASLAVEMGAGESRVAKLVALDAPYSTAAYGFVEKATSFVDILSNYYSSASINKPFIGTHMESPGVTNFRVATSRNPVEAHAEVALRYAKTTVPGKHLGL
jgi:pimeloyl-ACP methyl ester carboxylesterase